MPSSRIIFITGMHRSGTSTVTRGIIALGAWVGENLLSPTPGNPKGYFESHDVVKINDQLLRALGANWKSAFLRSTSPANETKRAFDNALARIPAVLCGLSDGHRLVAIKDPRLCHLAPFWFAAASELGLEYSVVLVCRHPVAVVESVVARNGLARSRIAKIWLGHLTQALNYNPDVVIDYDSLLDNPQCELERLAAMLGLDLPGKAALDDYLHDFLDDNLRRSRPGEDELEASMASLVKEYPAISAVWEQLAARSRITPSTLDQATANGGGE